LSSVGCFIQGNSFQRFVYTPLLYNKGMKNLLKLITLFVFLLPLNVWGAGFMMEPIVGVERVQRFVPNAYTKDRFIYGVRATYGVTYLSLEGEYSLGEDTHVISASDLEIRIRIRC
jgi:hypothetical protein